MAIAIAYTNRASWMFVLYLSVVGNSLTKPVSDDYPVIIWLVMRRVDLKAVGNHDSLLAISAHHIW